MSNCPVHVELHDHVLVLTIDRPERRNALDGATARALAEGIDRLDTDPDVRVGILTGAGGVFSAGMDLKAFLDGDTPEIPGRGLGGLTAHRPARPLVAAVEGWALAGGFELVLACDMVVAGASARFGLPEVQRALVAGAGGVMRLPRAVPPAIAMELLLTGEPVDADRAASLGLVNRVVPEGQALEEALRLARRIAANGPLAVEATRRIALESRAWSDEEMWDRQAELLAPVMASEDAQEGARAFAERRDPVWRGR